MSSRPVTPASGAYGNMTSHLDDVEPNRPALGGSKHASYLSTGLPRTSGLEHSEGGLNEEPVLEQSMLHNEGEPVATEINHEVTVPPLNRSASRMSQSQTQTHTPSRAGTLKKKSSLKRAGSVGRTASRRNSYAGSVRSMKPDENEVLDVPQNNNAFFCPIPTTGNPTELLADRFQSWRKVLKDLINYFRELSKGYDARARAMLNTSNVINNTTMPANFLSSGGLGDALTIVRDFQKLASSEATKAHDVENEIVMQLTGLRSDLQQKIKEIKSLSGDFKNNVDKEQNNTNRAATQLQESLGQVDHDAAGTSSKGDPFIIKLAVDRQLERQIEEENYLHRAYLNLENSGRELESIVVGEIQKAYNAYAGILRREADEAYDTSEKLKAGPLGMSKDHEWDRFTQNNRQMVDPRLPVRQLSNITYPGKDNPLAIDVRSGMLERKSKYLRNYQPGWYVLSPTHLHEFKSADRIASQSPILSLFLPEQKLGKHTEINGNSHKFALKGSQSGGMHRGHNWTLRAESHDTMMAWYNDIKELTEKKGEARNEYVRRQHARSVSGHSLKAASIGAASSNDGIEDDEADKVPYSSEQSVRGPSVAEGAGAGVAGGALGVDAIQEMEDNRSEAGWRPPQRPSPGGRFPSDVNVARGLQAPHSPSSEEISDIRDPDHEVMMAAGSLPGSGVPFTNSIQGHTELQPQTATEPAGVARSASAYSTQQMTPTKPKQPAHIPDYIYGDFRHGNTPIAAVAPQHDDASNYGEWMAPIATGAGAGVGGAAIGAAGAQHYYDRHHQQQLEDERRQAEQRQIEQQRRLAEQAQLEQERRQAEQSRFIDERQRTEQPRFEDDRQETEQASFASEQQMGNVENTAPFAGTAPVARDPDRPIESIDNVKRQMDDSAAVPAHGTSSAPIFVETSAPTNQVEDQERSLSRPRGATESTQATGYTTTTNPSTFVNGPDARYGGAPSSVAESGGSLSTVPTSVDFSGGGGGPAPPSSRSATTEMPYHQDTATSGPGALTAAGFGAGPMSQDELMEQQSPKDATGRLLVGGFPPGNVDVVNPMNSASPREMHMPGEFPGSVYNAVTI